MTVRQLRQADERCLYSLAPFKSRSILTQYCADVRAVARKEGLTGDLFGEWQAVVGMANETNRLANGCHVPPDDAFTLTD